MNENGWNEWSRHVLAELERLNERIEQISQKQGELLVEIARLQIKSGIWGGLAAAGVVALFIAFEFLKGR